MKKLFLIILLLVISNISYSQFHIGQSITLKDSSGYLVINAPIKTNTSIDWLSPKNLDSSIAGSGLSLSTSSGLIVNVGKGLQIISDTIITTDGLIDTTNFGRLIGNQTWTGNNTFSNQNIFYGQQLFDTISLSILTSSQFISGVEIQSYSNIYSNASYKIGDYDNVSTTVIDANGNFYANYLTVDSILTDDGTLDVNGNIVIDGDVNASTLTTTGTTQVGSLYSTGTISTDANTITFYGLKIYAGSGSPEGVKTADVGSLYLRTNGGANTSLYVKESGAGNTGWVAK